ILNRGGEADDVLRAVLAALHERGVTYAAIRFVEDGVLVDGPHIGARAEGCVTPIVYEGNRVGELELAVEDATFARRVGTLIPADFEITNYDPGKRLAFRATAGPVRPEGGFDFVEEGGATRVTFKLDAELKGMKKLMAPMVGKSMRNEVESLDRLKQILETG